MRRLNSKIMKEIKRELKRSSSQEKKLLPLMMPTFGEAEILDAIDSLISLNVTMGEKVEKFETAFSKYLGTKYSTMLNSGSSANLLGLTILSNPSIKEPIRKNDEILVPAVTWSTSIFPILNIGAKPVLVDIDDDYLIDIEKMKELIGKKTKAIIPVHLLGNVCDMGAIHDLAKDNDLYLMEDCCEALGSEYKGKKVGTFSDISSFSTYFSHHITTIEGGMLCTNNVIYADLSRIIRAHGYVRHSLRKNQLVKENPRIDPRFLFVNIGYNFRPMEIQGAFGIHQLKKLKGFLKQRATIGRKFTSQLKRYSEFMRLPREKKDTRHSWFVFPITVLNNKYFKREDLTNYLESKGIETRPLVCGNFEEQPAMRLFKHRTGDLTNSKSVMRNSFYFGIHPMITDEIMKKVITVFDEFFTKMRK